MVHRGDLNVFWRENCHWGHPNLTAVLEDRFDLHYFPEDLDESGQ